MTGPRLILMLLACVAAVCAIAATHSSAPSRSTYWKTICYLGRNGQSGGCVQVWVNDGPVPQ